MTTEQEVLDDLIQAITNTNTSNDDFLKVLKEGRDQDVPLRDGTVVPSLTKRVVNAFSNSDYLMKADNLASVVDKQEARDNLNVPTKEEVAQATEAVKGTAKIATTAIAQAGVNNTDIMTPAKVRSVSFGQGQTRKTRTLVSGVEYTNTNNKPIVVGFSLRSDQGGNAKMPIDIKLGAITVIGNTLSGTTEYRTVYEFTILPQEKYTFTISNATTFFDVAWEIS